MALASIGTFLSLTALGWAVLGGIRLYRLCRALAARRSSAPVPREPIERLGTNLCRLRSKLEEEENKMFTPFKAARVRALRAAYVDVLCAACEELEILPPAVRGNPVAPLTEIYRAEEALRESGLDVRRRIAT